jgi:tetratricopeptide (TPR) repeat protein
MKLMRVCIVFSLTLGGLIAVAAIEPKMIASARLNQHLIECLSITQAKPCGCSLQATGSDRAGYHLGLDAFRSGQPALATAYLDAYVKRHPQDEVAGYFLGLSYRSIGDERAALSVWRNTGATRAFRASAWQTGAIEDFQTVIAAGGADPDTLYQYAELELSSGDSRAAEEAYRKGLADDVRSDYRRALAQGRLAELSGDLPTARAIDQKVIQLRPSAPDAYDRLGQICWLRLKQPRAALGWYELCASKTDSMRCFLAAGEMNRELGDYSMAHTWGLRAQLRFPASAEPLLFLASNFEAQKRLGEADLAYETAGVREPRNFWVPYDRGVLAMRQGDPARAVRYLRRAAELNPVSPYIHSDLGRAYLAIGDDRRAMASFRRVIELNPGNAEAVREVSRLENRDH